MKISNTQELICVLVTKGFTDAAIEAARNQGALGGTIIAARGNAAENASKNYGIVITPDKDLILMLVDNKIKNKVIRAIYKASGIETNGKAIIWTMPANNVVSTHKTPKVKKSKKSK